jgi:hypothetical protein
VSTRNGFEAKDDANEERKETRQRKKETRPRQSSRPYTQVAEGLIWLVKKAKKERDQTQAELKASHASS